jgi:glycosyltransferase involved in cell wall biosynthesis
MLLSKYNHNKPFGYICVKKPRVLFLLHELSLTGAPRVALNICEILSSHTQLHVITLDDGPLRSTFEQWARVRVLSVSAASGKIFSRGAALRVRGSIISQFIKRYNPDLIYINSCAALALLKYLPLPRSTTILHIHETGLALEGYIKQFRRQFFEQPDFYVAPSEYVAREVSDNFRIPSDRLRTIHSFIDESEFDLPLVRNTSPTHFLIGGAGSLTWCKGGEMWLLMAYHLLRMRPKNDVRFTWIGIGDSANSRQFLHTAKKLGINSVLDTEPASQDRLKRFLELDVFAMTSWEESASLVTLENMALAKPVICFEGSGGPPELLGAAGIAVTTFSPLYMAAAINQLVNDPAKRAKIGKAARERVIQNFTSAAQAPKVLDLIHQSLMFSK